MDIPKLLTDVFRPKSDERCLIMIDVPRLGEATEAWTDRGNWAEEWRSAFATLPGTTVYPLLAFEATGANGVPLPEFGMLGGEKVRITEVLERSDIVIAMTQYSASGPLLAFNKAAVKNGSKQIRAASMPGVLRRMQNSALAADYRLVAERVHLLKQALESATLGIATFSTGHRMDFDLRYNPAHADDGICAEPGTLINLPSGEAYKVPYEGQIPNDPSKTEGEIPISKRGELFVLRIRNNRIESIQGNGPEAQTMRDFFDCDPARRNVAELGLGCNDRAVVTGIVLEDEKAGMHWAYGRSEYMGGTVSPASFKDPKWVIHQDVVYANGCPIQVAELTLVQADDRRETVIKAGNYTLW